MVTQDVRDCFSTHVMAPTEIGRSVRESGNATYSGVLVGLLKLTSAVLSEILVVCSYLLL